MKVLTFNPQRCDGTRACEVTCAETWFKVTDVAKSSIRIQPKEAGFGAQFCIQCGQCIDVCPTNALFQDKQGIVRVRKQLCVGCLSCVGFCPYGVMYFDTAQTLVFKCIACGQCVKACPTQALEIIETDNVSTDLWERKSR
ncbi:MAG: 4Fe-4S dicluster domain-containing protein [Anaerolineae bacterium]|nr:4Fe-4S dicluster domain-containing protein [Anaerolineae bacterium]